MFLTRTATDALKVAFALGGAISFSANAAPLSDPLYIHCRNAAGDFRISELNHSVSQFSDRYQQYRTVCRDCTVTEWGDRITLKDGSKTFVQVNRMTGDVQVQRNDVLPDSGPFDVRSFHGTCVKGEMVKPTVAPASVIRAF